MDRWIRKLAIVTGASSGIGEAISKSLVRSGVNVLGLSKHENKLHKLQRNLGDAKGSFHYLKCDITSENDILSAFEYAEKQFRGIDILVNNAGIVKPAMFDATKMEDLRSIMDVNVVGATTCIREALKSMRRRKKEGHIFNINSICGLKILTTIAFPINIYPASKSAMRTMSDMLRMELQEFQDNIKLTSIYPGLVRTAIFDESKLDKEQIFSTCPALESEDIADSVMYALAAPSHIQVEDIVISAIRNKK